LENKLIYGVEMQDKIYEIIKMVMANSSINNNIEITNNANLRNDLSLDSLALAELAVRVEEAYDVDVFEDGIVETVQEIIDKIS
jgi:acyl carrier protein